MTGDLETLIGSKYPIILIKTWKGNRALEEVSQVTDKLKLPLFHWSVTKGLCAFRA